MTFAKLPGFKAYDDETQTFSFTDRDVTVTLPEGRRSGFDPVDMRAPVL